VLFYAVIGKTARGAACWYFIYSLSTDKVEIWNGEDRFPVPNFGAEA